MKKIAILGCTLAMLMLGGCSSVTSVSMDSEGEDPNIVFENRSRSNKLIFLRVEDLKHRTVGSLMQAQATVTNTTGFELEFEYQFRFFDKDGFSVSEDSRPWTPVVLQGKSNKQVKALAPNPSATTVKIFIKK